MSDYDNKGRFSLWKNDSKREGKQDADYTGTFTDEQGNEYWVNGWGKKPGSSDKAPVLSGSIRLKEQQQSGGFPSQGGNQAKSQDPFASGPDFGAVPDDDIGF
jgi:hypothetical protein